ncbi:recombinase RecT [Bacillus sp. 1P06AnD]|uniref:recombinase RecT n=1 Tax=Bacillus sp. 1P06AnD TaxID=3132208 RepID=UPI00399FA162
MTKLKTFTEEQKSLIWTTKLQAARATEHDSRAFIEVCEEYGLNPLLGDITFQRFETKYGPRVSYLISRDAYLKYAMRQDDFQTILSGVVREGDHFEVDVVEGVPIHKFGAKRGKIIGAWSVVKTKTRGNTLVFPDFAEYHAALSPKNPVWNTMPSAMIEKVAQSTALKRTFPLGVVFSSEDDIIQDDFTSQTTSQQNVEASSSSVSMADELEAARKQKESKQKDQPSKREAAETEKYEKEVKKPSEKVKPAQTKAESQPAEIPVEKPKAEEKPKAPISKEDFEPPIIPISEEETDAGQVDEKQPVNPPVTEEQVEKAETSAIPLENVLEFVSAHMGVSGNQTKFLRVQYKQGNEQRELFARGDDKIALFDEYVPGTTFMADIEEINGFAFVHTAKAV